MALRRDSQSSLTQYLCRRFRGDIALRSAQQFKADHELPDRRRTQQRWIKVSVQLPFWMRLPIARRGMQPHGIRKRSIEDPIVRRSDSLEDSGEVRTFGLRQRLKLSHMPPRQNHYFKRPHRPERNHSDKACIRRHHTFARPLLEREVGTQKHRVLLRKVRLLTREFRHNLIGDRLAGPDLTVRMRIACAHHRTTILEDLHVADVVARTQLNGLFDPRIHHRTNLLHRHLRQREVMTRRKTDHPAGSALALGDKESLAGLVTREPWSVQLQCCKVILEDIGAGVFFSPRSGGPHVSRTQIAVRIVGQRSRSSLGLGLPLPRSLRPMGGHQYPLPLQRIEPPMGILLGQRIHCFPPFAAIANAPSEGSLTKHCAAIPVRSSYSRRTVSTKLSAFSALTTFTVHPPNPPPVIRAPKQPSWLIAISTRVSTSAQLAAKSSRILACA